MKLIKSGCIKIEGKVLLKLFYKGIILILRGWWKHRKKN